MRSAILACTALSTILIAAPAFAEEKDGGQQLDWQYDFGLTLPRAAKFPHRFLFRWNTETYHDDADTYLVQYGRGWRWNDRFLMKFALGYAGTAFEAHDARHELVLTMTKNMTWDRGWTRLSMEASHFLGAEGYRYRGYYAFDWRFIGVHVAQEGGDTLAGFQLTSGTNPEIPLRVEARHSFGVIGDAPEHVIRIVVVMDTD